MACWIFFWGVGYAYIWFFAIPWLLWCLLRRITSATAGLPGAPTMTSCMGSVHSKAAQWAFWTAYRFTTLQLVLFGTTYYRGAMVPSIEFFGYSLVLGAATECRSGIRPMVSSMLLLGGVTFGLALLYEEVDYDTTNDNYNHPTTIEKGTNDSIIAANDHSFHDDNDSSMKIDL